MTTSRRMASDAWLRLRQDSSSTLWFCHCTVTVVRVLWHTTVGRRRLHTRSGRTDTRTVTVTTVARLEGWRWLQPSVSIDIYGFHYTIGSLYAYNVDSEGLAEKGQLYWQSPALQIRIIFKCFLLVCVVVHWKRSRFKSYIVTDCLCFWYIINLLIYGVCFIAATICCLFILVYSSVNKFVFTKEGNSLKCEFLIINIEC